MRVRAQPDGLEPPVEAKDVRSVVVFDDFDNPILVVQTLDKGQCICSRIGEPKFEEMLKQLGVGLNAEYTVVSDTA